MGLMKGYLIGDVVDACIYSEEYVLMIATQPPPLFFDQVRAPAELQRGGDEEGAVLQYAQKGGHDQRLLSSV